jgi:hypothetical protein
MDTRRTGAAVGHTNGETVEDSEDFAASLGALGQYRERLRELIRQHPASSIVVALVAGYLVGRLVRA